MRIPQDFLPSPAFRSSPPPNPLSLNGVAPLTFWGNVSIAVQFLYYCPLIFILANTDLLGSVIRVNGSLRSGRWGLVVPGTLGLVGGGCQTSSGA